MNHIVVSTSLILALVSPQPIQLQQTNTDNLQSMPSQTNNIDLQATKDTQLQNLDNNLSLEVIGTDSYEPKNNNNQIFLIVAIALIFSGLSLLVVALKKSNINPLAKFVFSKKEDKVEEQQ